MIRQFQPADAKACSDLIRACLRLESGLAANLREKLIEAESPESVAQKARMYYVAVFETESGIAGIGALEMNEIRLLYVAPEHQKKGVGSSLLGHLMSMVPEGIFADVFVYASPAAAGFYRKHAFRPGGECVFDIGGESLPSIFMKKPTRP